VLEVAAAEDVEEGLFVGAKATVEVSKIVTKLLEPADTVTTETACEVNCVVCSWILLEIAGVLDGVVVVGAGELVDGTLDENDELKKVEEDVSARLLVEGVVELDMMSVNWAC